MSEVCVVGSGRFRDADLGVVHYVVRRQSKVFSARWKAGEVQLSVPPRVSETQFYDALNELKPRLLARRPAASPFYAGQVINVGEFRVIIERVETNGSKLSARRCRDGWMLLVPESLNFDDVSVAMAISKMLRRIAAVEAPKILIPRARQLAAEVGRHPVAWAIGRGQRVLGHCSSKGYITLSSVLVLYPPELRDYVIFHEIAHLSEMNHSPRFHAICNAYCNGREAELVARLKAYKLPLR